MQNVKFRAAAKARRPPKLAFARDTAPTYLHAFRARKRKCENVNADSRATRFAAADAR